MQFYFEWIHYVFIVGSCSLQQLSVQLNAASGTRPLAEG